jgi:hypothetical protein
MKSDNRLVYSVPMVAAEYVAKLDEAFDPVPKFHQLYEINEKEKYLEEWRLDLLLGLIGHIIAFQVLLRFAWLDKHISTVAWVARNLLEIAVWTDYCCTSLDNARRLYEDAFRDSRDIIKAAEAMVPLYLARDPQSPIKDSVLEASQHLEKKAVEEGVADLDASYYSVSKAAEELGTGGIVKPIYKMLSKFAHPTALVLAKHIPGDKRFDPVLDNIFGLGVAYAVDAFHKLDAYLKAAGFDSIPR